MKTPSTNLVLIHGNDEFGVSEKARACVDALCPPDQRALGLEIVDGQAGKAEDAATAIKQCLEALRTMGFFGTEKVVWLRGVNFLGTGQTSKAELTKEWVGYLGELLKEGLPDGVTFVVSGEKVDSRIALYKLIHQKGEVEECSVSDKPWTALPEARAYAGSLFRELGRRIEPRALECFVERVGVEHRRLASEADKLCLYAMDEDPVTEASVIAVVSAGRETLIWDLSDALGARQPAKAQLTLEALREQGESAIGVVTMLERSVGQLLILRNCMDRQWVALRGQGRNVSADWSLPPEGEEILAKPFPDPRAIHPYRQALALQTVAKFSMRELNAWQTRVVRAHEKMVTTAVPHFLVLQQLILELMPLRRKA